jgi:natural product precursor
MKKKSIALNRKLKLNKEAIAALHNSQLDKIMGGATFTNPGCVGSNHCTVDLQCGPITRDEACQQETKLCA